MRLTATLLILLLACGSARAGDAGQANAHRRRSGAAMLGTGLALIGAGLVLSLSAFRPAGYYDATQGVMAGPTLAGAGLMLTVIGAPVFGVARADAEGPPTIETLKRRRGVGYGLIGLGVVMQAASLILCGIGMRSVGRLFESGGGGDPAYSATLMAGLIIGPMGIPIMTTGIPLVATAQRDLRLRVGATSLALTF
jgi:hypothetical protein